MWQTRSEKIEKVSRVGGCHAEHLPFHLELVTELGRLGLTTSRVTAQWKIDQKSAV